MNMVPQWQPIEAAPRDGTEVLLIIRKRRRIASWRKLRGWEGWDTGDEDPETVDYNNRHATLWHPLPEFP